MTAPPKGSHPHYGNLTKPSRPLNKDILSMVHRTQSAHAAHAALDPLQNLQPEVMVMGAALLFAAIARRCQLDPADLHTMALKVLQAQPGHRRDNDSLQSLQDFAGIRILGEQTVSIS